MHFVQPHPVNKKSISLHIQPLPFRPTTLPCKLPRLTAAIMEAASKICAELLNNIMEWCNSMNSMHSLSATFYFPAILGSNSILPQSIKAAILWIYQNGIPKIAAFLPKQVIFYTQWKWILCWNGLAYIFKETINQVASSFCCLSFSPSVYLLLGLCGCPRISTWSNGMYHDTLADPY